MGGNIMDCYEINASTLCIVPIDKNRSFVYEFEDCFEVNMSSSDIIKRSCLFFGSTFDGRKKFSVDLLNANYKLPIIIEEITQLIFFPTTSNICNNCIWISYNNYEYHEKNDSRTSTIKFKNGSIVSVDVSIFVLSNQIIRCNRLKLEFNKRKKAV